MEKMGFIFKLVLILFIQAYSCEESFLLAFQKSKEISADEWAEFDGKIPHLKAFTCCHWEKLHFFNIQAHYIWNYCTIKSSSDTMECIQMSYKREILSAGRDIEVGISFGKGNTGYMIIKPFRHRSWNHFCWSYDSTSGENRIYMNGRFYGSIQFQTKREAYGSDEVFGASFSVGQEPDAFRGKYDSEQAFRGNISELNLWDYNLNEKEILSIGTCKQRGKGNVISWDKDSFKLYNVTVDKVKDVSNFCIPEQKMFVFPERYSLPSAIALCKDHGGFLFTPRSQEENKKLLDEVTTYESECLVKSSGAISWLGAYTDNYELMLRDERQNLVLGNFTNWNSPLFLGENECVYMKKDGKWLANPNCLFLELCPVCRITGTPILTMKGNLLKTLQYFHTFTNP